MTAIFEHGFTSVQLYSIAHFASMGDLFQLTSNGFGHFRSDVKSMLPENKQCKEPQLESLFKHLLGPFNK